jgi:PPM family protein phosphatase
VTEHFAPPTGPQTGPVPVPAATDLGGGVGGGAPDAGPPGERTDMRRVITDAEDLGCPHCGATNPPREGHCPACGEPRPPVRDHIELTLAPAAGLTDRGLRRRRNEDAVALGRTTTAGSELLVGVVCDGVASARRGDEASLAAVEAAVDAVLAQVRREGTGTLDGLAATAASAAARAAAELGRRGDGADPPACTYVGAVVRDGSAVVSWVGDSRIYWLASDGTSQLLTTDDSWAEEIAATGLMTREQAHADRRAHVLTRWLGHDSPPGPARARRFRPAGPGLLMLCSDGVWNHIPDADDLAALLTGGSALDEARALVQAALDDGGYDNATVAVIPVVPGEGDSEWEPEPSSDTGPILVPLDEGPATGPQPVIDDHDHDDEPPDADPGR